MSFWGIEVKPDEPFTLIAEEFDGRVFMLTQATLGIGSSPQKSTLQVEVGDQKPIFLCTLLPGKSESFLLNLEFDEDVDVKFSVVGPTSIHLSGIMQVPEHEDDSDSDFDYGEGLADIPEGNELGSEDDSEDDSDDDDCEDDYIFDGGEPLFPSSPARKSGVVIEEIEEEKKEEKKEEKPVSEKGGNKKAEKKKEQQIVVRGKTNSLDLENEDEDEDELQVSLSGKTKKNKSDAKGDGKSSSNLKRKVDAMDEDQEPKSDANGGDASEDNKSKKKKNKKKAKVEKAETVADIKDSAGKVASAKQDVKKEEKKNSTPVKETKQAKDSKLKTFANGLIIEDLEMGQPSGRTASRGKKVKVRYTGKLKKNGKIFDSNLRGKPFKFRLGAGEVIKGWDVGVEGMRVGGKRRLTIPPVLGYGASGAKPDIPPNAWLVFDVELIEVA